MLIGSAPPCLLKPMLSRRSFIAISALALPRVLRASTNRFSFSPAAMTRDEKGVATPMPSTNLFSFMPAAIAKLEQVNSGRLGVAVLATGTGERSGHRQNERFPMCSTFKFLLVSAVLERVDRHQETLDRAVKIPPRPLLFHSPLTEPHAGGTMTIAALCHAAMTESDNTAANLLLETIEGPAGITTFSRSIGDKITRLDRWETALNDSLAGDLRDTTSPEAMADDLNSVLLGNVLSAQSRGQLTLWMEANLTGRERLRAKLPTGWRAADKTGSNLEHTSSDIAVIWPAGMPPIVISAYVTQCFGPESKRSAILAEIGRLVVESLHQLS